MNWKLIGQLSLLGLVMGVGTAFFIPSNIEPWGWLVVCLVSAYLIAAQTSGQRFVHGLLVGIANSVWVTGAHVLLVDRYLAGHAQEAAMMTSMPFTASARVIMAIVGPMIGVVSGCVIGLLAVVAGRLVVKR